VRGDCEPSDKCRFTYRLSLIIQRDVDTLVAERSINVPPANELEQYFEGHATGGFMPNNPTRPLVWVPALLKVPTTWMLLVINVQSRYDLYKAVYALAETPLSVSGRLLSSR
jgi:hypothetical protein